MPRGGRLGRAPHGRIGEVDEDEEEVQTSDFGLNTVDYHQLTRIRPRREKQVLGWCSSCEPCLGYEAFFR